MNRRTRTTVAVAASLAAMLLTVTACSSTGTNTAIADDCTPAQSVKTVTEGVLTVAATDAPPASSTADNGFSGYEADLLEDFAAANCLTIEAMPVSFAGAIPAIESGRADIATGGFYRTAARAEVVDLTAPLYLDMLAAVSADGITQISEAEGLKVGTVDGYMWTEDVRALFGDDVTVYPSSVEMRADLQAGRIAVAFDSYGLASALYADDDLAVEILEADDRLAATVEPAQVGFPVTKGNADLLAALDATVADWAETGRIAEVLTEHDLDPALAEVGEPRLL